MCVGEEWEWDDGALSRIYSAVTETRLSDRIERVRALVRVHTTVSVRTWYGRATTEGTPIKSHAIESITVSSLYRHGSWYQ